MQELWFFKFDWDESLPEDLLDRWNSYYTSLSGLEEIQIPRWTGQMRSSLGYELHGYSDASAKAYSVVVYLRILREDDDLIVTLLYARSKVAPLLPVSIPGLDLCGAQLLAKALRFLIATMGFENVPLYYHTDSTVVLVWLSKHLSTWCTFLSNRVPQIRKCIPLARWRHAPTEDNPADCSSRGLLPNQLLSHTLWWRGPPWLVHQSSFWPTSRVLLPVGVVLEPKSSVKTCQLAHHSVDAKQFLTDLADRIASWPNLIRVIAYCRRFIEDEDLLKSLALSASEINRASLWCSPLKTLNLFLDGSGVLGLGGRLHQAPIRYEEKHPVILPSHRISELIALHAHIRFMHGGIQLSLYTFRQALWIIGSELWLRVQQLMGSLPDFRTTTCGPFTHTGLGYAGPFSVRFAPGRGQKRYKGYVALFICCVARAIHLEFVSDYTSQGFLAAYQCFIARRVFVLAIDRLLKMHSLDCRKLVQIYEDAYEVLHENATSSEVAYWTHQCTQDILTSKNRIFKKLDQMLEIQVTPTKLYQLPKNYEKLELYINGCLSKFSSCEGNYDMNNKRLCKVAEAQEQYDAVNLNMVQHMIHPELETIYDVIASL
ncbi:uncharacterized protein LOC117179881 [Belonocnema kinseyi]|uniref:uncharacterized protein LOC117179881 n=1 Tax=Belonocnema kinseyi TaxID=2817044 RepID=UPI00143DFE48|nr:uncharacterized protein LOC117179881 [Belonocnema kinseyi]